MSNMIRLVLGLSFVASGIFPVHAGFAENGDNFAKGEKFAGVSAGAALGTQFFSSQKAHDLVMAQFFFGQGTSEEWAPDRWFGGNWTIAGELNLGYQYRSNAAAVAGLAVVSRYVFSVDGDWRPYLLAGVGANWTDMGEPDLGGKFQFSPQGGGGVYWLFHPDVAATLEYRFVHYSNGGLRSPNSGVNVNTFLIGLTFFR